MEESMEEGTSSTGGYLVPLEFDDTLVKALARENVIRSLAKVITTAAPHRINVALTDVSADWVAESGVFTPSTPTFNQLSLDAFTLRAAALVSEELLEDSMLQKHYRNNHLEKKKCRNTGELPMFFAEETHPAIIDMVWSPQQFPGQGTNPGFAKTLKKPSLGFPLTLQKRQCRS